MNYYNSNLGDYLNDNKIRIVIIILSLNLVLMILLRLRLKLTQVKNNLKNFKSLISDTTNSSKALLDYVREKSVIKSSVKLEKKSYVEINNYE